jgi:hypothetical protein
MRERWIIEVDAIQGRQFIGVFESEYQAQRYLAAQADMLKDNWCIHLLVNP